MKRYAETFFRYWLIALVPLIALPIAEYAMLKQAPKSVQSTANLWVDQGFGSASATGQFETPAQTEADAINQLIQSPSFDLAVAQASPAYRRQLLKAIDPSAAVTADLTHNLVADAAGANLLKITYSANNWDQAPQVVQSLINAVANQTAVLSQQQTLASITYYTNQMSTLRLNAADSARRLGDYMAEHNIKLSDVLALMPTDSTLATLYQQSQADQTAVANTQQQLSQLQTKSKLPPTLAQQTNFHIVDRPNVAVVSHKKQEIMNLAIALVLGLLLGGGFVVVKTLLDRSLRYSDEVPEMLGLPVLGVVPYNPSAGMGYPSRTPAPPKNSAHGRGGLLRRIG